MANIGRPSGEQWTIRYADQTAVVVEVGGGLRSYSVGGEDVLDGFGEDELCPGAAGQVLAPWPGRIRDGSYRFEGETYQLPLNDAKLHNAIHGLVRWLPWSVTSHTDDTVTVEVELHPQPSYPWRLRLTSTYTLGETGLRVTHTAHNHSGVPMPFGLGIHPYVRVPGVAVDDLLLTVPAKAMLLLDGRLLPIGRVLVAGSEFDYTVPRPIGLAILDVAYGDLVPDSPVVLQAPDGRNVQVWADASFRWWQLFTGETLSIQRRRRAVAIEPMTCPPDAMRSGRDLVILAPEESWQGEWGLTANL